MTTEKLIDHGAGPLSCEFMRPVLAFEIEHPATNWPGGEDEWTVELCLRIIDRRAKKMVAQLQRTHRKLPSCPVHGPAELVQRDTPILGFAYWWACRPEGAAYAAAEAMLLADLAVPEALLCPPGSNMSNRAIIVESKDDIRRRLEHEGGK